MSRQEVAYAAWFDCSTLPVSRWEHRIGDRVRTLFILADPGGKIDVSLSQEGKVRNLWLASVAAWR